MAQTTNQTGTAPARLSFRVRVKGSTRLFLVRAGILCSFELLIFSMLVMHPSFVYRWSLLLPPILAFTGERCTFDGQTLRWVWWFYEHSVTTAEMDGVRPLLRLRTLLPRAPLGVLTLFTHAGGCFSLRAKQTQLERLQLALRASGIIVYERRCAPDEDAPTSRTAASNAT